MELPNSVRAKQLERCTDANGYRVSVVVQGNESLYEEEDDFGSDMDDYNYLDTYEDSRNETNYSDTLSSESETEYLREFDDDDKIIDNIKTQTLKRIIKSHNFDEQSKLHGKFIGCYRVFSQEYNSLIADMKLYNMGLIDEEKVHDILNCLINIMNEMEAMFENETTFDDYD
ncbi:Uncharacterized protein QTN25_005844 [Entamoeba marina]